MAGRPPDELRRRAAVDRAARRLAASFAPDALERARENARLAPGSGGQHFITNARLRDFLEALSAPPR